jgi:hypothetical protein
MRWLARASVPQHPDLLYRFLPIIWLRLVTPASSTRTSRMTLVSRT